MRGLTEQRSVIMHLTTGEVIRRLRSSSGMTQRELGALIRMTQPAVSQLERNGPASDNIRVLRRVAKALGGFRLPYW
jgi:transcriptional regulator with XRE-family HTH domain